METELVMLEKMEANGDWLDENYEEVSKEFLNEFVAIKDAKIVAHGKRLDVLLETKKLTGHSLHWCKYPQFLLQLR